MIMTMTLITVMIVLCIKFLDTCMPAISSAKKITDKVCFRDMTLVGAVMFIDNEHG